MRWTGPPVETPGAPRRELGCLVLASPYSLQRITGIGRFIEDLTRGLGDRGIEVNLLCPSGTGATGHSGQLTLHWGSLNNVELSAKTARRLISERHGFTLVHAQQAHLQSVVAAIAGRVLGKPCVLTLHLKVPPPRGLWRRLAQATIEKLSVRWASVTVAVSFLVAESYGDGRVAVIENGVDTNRFRPSPSDRAEARRTLGIGQDLVFVFAG